VEVFSTPRRLRVEIKLWLFHVYNKIGHDEFDRRLTEE
jgi:hypothetical protein